MNSGGRPQSAPVAPLSADLRALIVARLAAALAKAWQAPQQDQPASPAEAAEQAEQRA